MSDDQHTNDISEKLKSGIKPKPAEYIIGVLAIGLVCALLYAFLSPKLPEKINPQEDPAVNDVNPPNDFVLPPSPERNNDDVTLLDLGGDAHIVRGGDDFLLHRKDYIDQGWLSSDTITLIGPSGKRLLIDRNQFLANRQYYINNGYLPAQHQILAGNDGRYVLIDNDYYNRYENEYKRSGYNIRTDEIGKGEMLSDSEYIKLLEQYINNGNQGPKPTRYR
jgi:hypothetical protein